MDDLNKSHEEFMRIGNSILGKLNRIDDKLKTDFIEINSTISGIEKRLDKIREIDSEENEGAE